MYIKNFKLNLEKYKMIKIIESIDNYQTRQILNIFVLLLYGYNSK